MERPTSDQYHLEEERQNPNAPFVDWTTKPPGEPYFDARNNQWRVVVNNNTGMTPGPSNRHPVLALGEEAVDAFLSDKSLNYATKLEKQEWVITNAVFFNSQYTPTRPNLSPRLLFCVKKEDYDLIIRAMEARGLDKPPAQESQKGASWVVLSPKEYETIFNDLESALSVIGKEYECAYRNGTYNVPNLRFGTQIKKVKKANAKLNDIFSKAGIKMKNIRSIALRKIPNDGKISIDQVWVENVLQEWVQIKTGTKNMHKKDPFDNQTIVNFIYHAPEIIRKFQSEKPPNYSDFIKTYYIPLPESAQKALDPVQGASTLIKGFGSDGTGAASCAANFAGSFLETVPGNEVSGQLTKYSDCLENKYNQKHYDARGKKELEAILNDPNLSQRRIADALNTTVPRHDPVVEQLRYNIESSKSLRELYITALDPLGVDGIAKLLGQGALQQLKCLTLDAAVKQMCLSALEVTTSTQISELYKNTVVDTIGSKLNASLEFEMAWADLSFIDSPPSEEEVQPASFTPPPNRDITKKKVAFSIGVPTISINPLIGQIRSTFIFMVETDMVSAYAMLEEILNTPLVSDAAILGIILGLNSVDIKAKFKPGKPKLPVTMPYIPPIIIPDLGDLAKVAIQFAKQALDRAATEIAKNLMQKVLDVVFSYCEDPSVADNIIGSSRNMIHGVIRSQICSPSATDDEVAETMRDLLNSFTVWDTSYTYEPPNSSDVGDFMRASSESISPQEMIDLFNGRASQHTISNLLNVVENLPNDRLQNALSTPAAMERVFSSLGTLINRNALQAQKDYEDLVNTPTSPLICKPPFQVVAEDKATIAALEARGLSDKEIGEQIQESTFRALEKLDDLVKTLLNSGDMMGSKSGLPSQAISNDPRNPEAGLFPIEDPATQNFNSWMFNDVYNTLDNIVIQDLMIGKTTNMFSKGFLDMILSSKSGRGYIKISEQLIDKDGEYVYTNLKNEVPEIISGLKENYFEKDISEFISVTMREVSAEYIAKKLKIDSSTGTSTDPATTAEDSSTFSMSYEIGGNISIGVDDKESDKETSTQIAVSYSTDQSVLDYISEVSPDTSIPSQILGEWCENVLSEYLQEDSATASPRQKFISGTKNYVSSVLYPSIVEEVLNIFCEKVSAEDNDDAWKYGTGEVTSEIVDLNPDEYGEGSFYIKTCKRDFEGWMNIYNNSVPTIVDGQEQVPLFNFIDIKKDTEEFYNTVPIDDRIQVTQVVFKKFKEPPFCRINNRINNAILAGSTKATVRLHIYDSLIKGSPFFRLYSPDIENYGEVLSSYIVDAILEAVFEESLSATAFQIKPLGIKGYYYLFLEQTVQSYSNMINTGLMAPSSSGQSALRILTEKIQDWKPGLDRVKNFKKFLDDSLPYIKIILGDIVAEQLGKANLATRHVLRAQHENLEEDILDNWIYGGLSSEAPRGPGPISVPISMTESDTMPTGLLDFPFILEKFVRLVDKDGRSIVVSPSEATSALLQNYDEYFIGTRLVMYMPDDFESNFDSETINYMKQELKANFDQSRSFIVTPNNQSGARRYLIPLVVSERPANMSDFVDTAAYITQAREMMKSPAFRTLFEICIPIPSLLSFLTIYTIENFVESLAVEDRDSPLSLRDFSFWNGATFQNSQKYLKTVAQQSYYGRDSEYINEINLEQSKPYLNMAAVMGVGAMASGFDKLIRKLPKWRRKKRRPVPPGTDPCEDL